jgi:hypothetical protein
MHSRLRSRIARIEKAMPKPPQPPVHSAVPFFEALFNAAGIERGPKESLAKATSRALGIGTSELRALLQRRAAGLR